MQKQLLRFLLFTFFFLPQFGYAQVILAPNADYSDTASYFGKDSLFVFNIDNSSELYIIADTQSFPTYSIQWEEYIPGTGFQVMATTDPKIVIDKTKTTQGYVLRMQGDTTEWDTCWVMINDFSVEILTKDENDTITKDALSSGDCIWIGYIELSYIRDKLLYYNPSNSNPYYLNLSYSSSDTIVPTPDAGYGRLMEVDSLNGLLRFSINNSWWKDAEYTINITDEAGLSRSDFVIVKAIRPRAIFPAPELIHLDNEDYYPDRDELYYSIYGDKYHAAENHKSSPGLYSFDGSGSFHADSLIWHFGDSTKINTSRSDTIHQYTHYGVYEVWLEVINYFDFRRECYHTSDKSIIELSTPTLSAPNVFSPPGGSNPIWRYDDVSIVNFEIAIYNRYGLRVHYFEGNVRDWGGWDGTANKSSNYVSSGVYYYILKDFSHSPLFNEVTEDNKPVFESAVYKGFIHVFNSE